MTKKLIAASFISLLALTGCSTASVEKPAEEPVAAEAPVEEVAAKEGTRENPLPVGSTITDGDWELTINSVTLDATDAATSANPFNEAPADGNQYLMVNLTATYNGDDPNGSISMHTIEYVTSDGNTINSYDNMVVAPEPFDSISTLYTGASTTGNEVFEVPTATAGEGTLAVRADMMGDKFFVSVQ